MSQRIDAGWDRAASPFHAGEVAIQEQLGVRERMDGFARRVIRDWLPPEHRSFYADLPAVFAGALDADGHPWATLLGGGEPFIEAPDDRTLRLAATPDATDPARAGFARGAHVGLLGFDFMTRRRNRVNGRLLRAGPQGLEFGVDQAFGNCPKFIQTRELNRVQPDTRTAEVITELAADTDATRMILASDTFFLASRSADLDPADPTSGVDVSHRGGKPGFVRVLDGARLEFPDFSGNRHFNTLGNLLLDARAGLLFVDFESGDILQLTGSAQIVSEPPAGFAGAERSVIFTLREGWLRRGSSPLRGRLTQTSPFLARTGGWKLPA